MFWNKKKRTIELITKKVPLDKVRHIFELRDKYFAMERDQDSVARYDMWVEIRKAIPDLPPPGTRMDMKITAETIEINYEVV